MISTLLCVSGTLFRRSKCKCVETSAGSQATASCLARDETCPQTSNDVVLWQLLSVRRIDIPQINELGVILVLRIWASTTITSTSATEKEILEIMELNPESHFAFRVEVATRSPATRAMTSPTCV